MMALSATEVSRKESNVSKKTLIILDDGKVAAVPSDSTVERSLENLREVGLKPVLVKHPDGTEDKLDAKGEAA